MQTKSRVEIASGNALQEKILKHARLNAPARYFSILTNFSLYFAFQRFAESSRSLKIKIFQKSKMLVIFLSMLFVAAANGYKSGAPVVACDSMTPGHNVESQIGPSRHSFTTSKSIIFPGDELTITLKSFSANDDFKGFFIQARDPRTQGLILYNF